MSEPARQGRVVCDGRRRLRPIANAEPATEVEPLDRKAAAAQLQREVDEPLEGRLEGRQIGQLRADVDGKANRLEARQRRGAPKDLGRMSKIDPELVLLLARGDL